MNIQEQAKLILLCQEKLSDILNISPLSTSQQELENVDNQINNSELWNNPQQAANLLKNRTQISNYINFISQASDYINMFNEINKSNNSLNDNDIKELNIYLNKLNSLLFTKMLKDPIDQVPAILSINAGAGGLEAANWVSMLYRMYVRYANSQDFKIEVLDEKLSEEHSSICTDSISIRIDGLYAFGFLKNESGVHRLIRNSPFNANDARQTSFAAVYVTPDIEDNIDIKIDEKDLEIITQTAGGPGGQHQNKTRSAIRLKHLPTNINIVVRTERDQHANRKIAMKMLKAKLYDLEMKKKQEEQDKKIANLSNISFGNQIRTYTLMPFKLVKDHRTNFESNDANSVLDGNIHDFIMSCLLNNAK